MTKKKASQRGPIIRVNYTTLYKKFGKAAVDGMELELECRYPLAFGKATGIRRLSILSGFLDRAIGLKA